MSFQHIVKIPHDRIGALIGSKGKVKLEIEKRCGVQVEIDGETGDAVISDTGNAEKLELFKAIEVISAIARGFSPQRAYRLFQGGDNPPIFIQIDLRSYAGKSSNNMERIKGRIIGEAGKSRRTIEELTGASVSVYGHTVSLIGTYRETRIASEAITMLSKGSMHKNVYKMLQNVRRKDKLDRMRLWEDSSG